LQLTWPLKLRIWAVIACGILLIGLWAWPLAKPYEPMSVLTAYTGAISTADVIILAGVAFLMGLIAFFISWPYGREIGVLAVPAGLAFWAARAGNVSDIILYNPGVEQRVKVFAAFKWESILWLVIIAAGYYGVMLGQKVFSPRKSDQIKRKQITKPDKNKFLSPVIAIISSMIIAHIFIKILARNVQLFDSQLETVIAQPATAQIVFAVSIAFGLAAFVVKKFLDVSYIWPIIASGLLTYFTTTSYVKQDILLHLSQKWPPVFLQNALLSILPIQMVVFGALGSIAGYWLAVRYAHWQKDKIK